MASQININIAHTPHCTVRKLNARSNRLRLLQLSAFGESRININNLSHGKPRPLPPRRACQTHQRWLKAWISWREGGGVVATNCIRPALLCPRKVVIHVEQGTGSNCMPKHQPKQHYNMHHQHNQQQARLQQRRNDDDGGGFWVANRSQASHVVQPISLDLRGAAAGMHGAGLPSSWINLDMCVPCSTSLSALVLFASSSRTLKENASYLLK